MREVYLDNMATTLLDERVLEKMWPYFRENFANALSPYPMGVKAREAVELAREEVAKLIGASPSELIFTSGGTEANNFALRGLAYANRKKGNHIIVSAVEHHSITNPARALEKEGFEVTFVPVDRYGVIDLNFLERALREETILISIQLANPEVGTIQPIEEVVKLASKVGAVVHTDCVAAIGRMEVKVDKLGVHSLSLSAHIFYGPKGAGALYVKRGVRIQPLIYGGIQEGGRRGGTENVPAIVGLGEAARLVRENLPQWKSHLSDLSMKLIKNLQEKVEHLHLTGHPEKRLPGHASFIVEFIEGEALLLMLAHRGIYVSSGSTCTSKALKASPVLSAMGYPAHLIQGSILMALSKYNNEEDIDYVVSEFPQVVSRLRELSPFKEGWKDMDKWGACAPH
ncbi:MAG: cysteine desulfurase [Caldimicrobium sp.]|nr:cysteine desulfurase [Caldimicrobium sp.]